MDKTKLVPIILLVILVAVGFFAFLFYNDSRSMRGQIFGLEDEKARLFDENNRVKKEYNSLKDEFVQLDREKGALEQRLREIQGNIGEWQRRYESVVQERDGREARGAGRGCAPARDRGPSRAMRRVREPACRPS